MKAKPTHKVWISLTNFRRFSEFFAIATKIFPSNFVHNYYTKQKHIRQPQLKQHDKDDFKQRSRILQQSSHPETFCLCDTQIKSETGELCNFKHYIPLTGGSFHQFWRSDNSVNLWIDMNHWGDSSIFSSSTLAGRTFKSLQTYLTAFDCDDEDGVRSRTVFVHICGTETTRKTL